MNLAFIEGFIETALTQSVAKASERLNISHAALSKQIKSLEAYYGQELFHRSHLGVTLTEPGQLLLERIRPVYAELLAIKQEMAGSTWPREVRLGSLPSVASHVLPGILLEMERQGMKVSLDVRDTSGELSSMLRNGQIDAAVLEYWGQQPPFWHAVLFEEPYEAVVYAGHPFADMTSVSVGQISREPLILHPPDCTTRILLSRLMQEVGAEPLVRTEVRFGDFIFGYVSAGAGITIAPKLATRGMDRARLVSVLIDEPRFKRSLSLVSVSGQLGKSLLPFFRVSSDRSLCEF